MATRKRHYIGVPSFFWDDFLFETNEKLKSNPHIQAGNAASNKARAIIERTNERIKAIRQDPTATDPQKEIRIEKIGKSAKADLERLINNVTQDLATNQAKILNEIQSNIENADRIQAMETRQRLASMNPAERSAFIRQLKAAGDYESISHILSRSAAFLGMDQAEYEETQQAFISGAHPQKATDLKALKIAQNNLKKGLMAVIEDFDSFSTSATEKAAAAEAALTS